MLLAALIAAVSAFLLGSIPFGYLVVRLRRGDDIRARGSGNIGATNVLRSAGKVLGAFTLLLDIVKGSAAVLLAEWLACRAAHQPFVWVRSGSEFTTPQFTIVALAEFLVVAGHLYTPWLGFRGGKGVATGLGVMLALAPAAALCALALFILVVAVWKYVSVASIVSAGLLPLLLVLWRPGFPASVAIATAVISLLVIWRHAPNLRRLRLGTEPKLGAHTAGSSA